MTTWLELQRARPRVAGRRGPSRQRTVEGDARRVGRRLSPAPGGRLLARVRAPRWSRSPRPRSGRGTPEPLDLVLLLLRRWRRRPRRAAPPRADDPGAGAQRQRDRVGGPRADLDAAVEDQARRRRRRPGARRSAPPVSVVAERLEDVLEQVVGQRPGRHDALLGVGDRGRLGGPDPDRQVAVTVALPQQHDRLVGRHLDPDADDIELSHPVNRTPLSRGARSAVRGPARRVTRAACSREQQRRAISAPRRPVPRASPRPRARADHLLDQADLAVGRGPERAAGAAARGRTPPARRRRGRWPAPSRRSSPPARRDAAARRSRAAVEVVLVEAGRARASSARGQPQRGRAGERRRPSAAPGRRRPAGRSAAAAPPAGRPAAGRGRGRRGRPGSPAAARSGRAGRSGRSAAARRRRWVNLR